MQSLHGALSFTCAASHIPVVGHALHGKNSFSEVVVVLHNGNYIRGHYDGMGNIDLPDGRQADVLHAMLGAGERCKFVLAKFFHGQSFYELPRSHRDPGHGYSHTVEELQDWHSSGGFPDFNSFLTAFRNSKSHDQQNDTAPTQEAPPLGRSSVRQREVMAP